MTNAFDVPFRPRGPSLQGELLCWTLGLIAVACAVFAFAVYRAGLQEADELLDNHLATVGALVALGGLSSVQEAARALPLTQEPSHRHYERSLSVVVRNEAGDVAARAGPAPLLRATVTDGFATLDGAGRAWRVFSRDQLGSKGLKVSVLVNTEERDDLAREIVIDTVTPALWLFPLLGVAITFAVRRGLRPLRDLDERVRALDFHTTGAARLPAQHELRPLVSSIGAMSERYRVELDRERQLADTLAHELRTPLTSLQLHASALKQGLCPADREAAIEQLDRDAKRAAETVAALVSLARGPQQPWRPIDTVVDLASLVRDVVKRHASTAQLSRHSLKLVAPERCLVRGHAVLLDLAIGNLVANALGHTPSGTAIEVHVWDQPPTVQVRDDGASRSASVAVGVDLLGLGVGHRIADRVAQAHDGHFMPSAPNSLGWRSYTITLSRLSYVMAQRPAEVAPSS